MVVPPDGVAASSKISGITFEFPPSPLLSQRDDISDGTLCNGTHKPSKCANALTCSCAHMYSVPLNSIVEIVLLDVQGNINISHPFHLHGTVFQVLALGDFSEKSSSNLTPKKFKELEREGLVKRNFDSPPYKDSIAVPYKGYAILRSKLTNPGYWFMHCHFLYHIMIGMNFIIQVGERNEMAAVPEGFPKCKNFKSSINQDPTRI